MLVGGDHLTKGGGVSPGVGVLGPDLVDHGLEPVDLARELLAARLGTGEAQTELEVLLVADEDVTYGRDLVEGLRELRLPTGPEGGPVVEVEADQGAVPLGHLGELQAALGGLGAHGRDEAGEVQDAYALLAEDAIEVEVTGAEGPSHFAGPVVPHPGGTEAEAGVGDVELGPIAPGAALRNVQPLVADVPSAKLGFDEGGHGAALHELGQDQALLAQGGGYVQNVALGAGGLQVEQVAVVDRHPILGGDPKAHAGGAGDGILVILSHILAPLVFRCIRRRSKRKNRRRWGW